MNEQQRPEGCVLCSIPPKASIVIGVNETTVIDVRHLCV